MGDAPATKDFCHPMSWNFYSFNVAVEGLAPTEKFSHLMSWSLELSGVVAEGLTPAKNISHLISWSTHLSTVVAEERGSKGTCLAISSIAYLSHVPQPEHDQTCRWRRTTA